MSVVIWHGTEKEAQELLAAIGHNCGCAYMASMRTSTCAAHEMLTSDQRTMDHLVFCRRNKERWISGEFNDK